MLMSSRAHAPAPLRDPEPIAIMIGQLGQGGSERQLYIFLSHCDRRRWSPAVYVSGELGAWEAPIRALEIPVVLLRGHGAAKMWHFRSACRLSNARCFFSWSSYTNAYGLALVGSGVRRIGSFRNASFSDLPERGRRLWTWASLAGISSAICNSRETCETIARRRRAEDVIYVPNAVEMFPSVQIAAWREQWRERLGLKPESVLVMGVGRLAPQKNFARFIDVIGRAAKRSRLHAVIAGEDRGCLADLKKQVAEQGLTETIRFLGKVPDARELICAADIFLLTSDHEGMSNVVLESMSAGVPCISTPVNGIGDLIRHGANGFIANPNAKELADHVHELATHRALRRMIGRNARATIERLHQPSQVAGRLWELCDAHPKQR